MREETATSPRYAGCALGRMLGLVVVRLAGPALVSVSAVGLCHAPRDWIWFGLGLFGAGLAVMTGRSGGDMHTERTSHVIDATDLRDASKELIAALERPLRVEPIEISMPLPSPASIAEPTPTSIEESDRRDPETLEAKWSEVVSALVNLGHGKRDAGTIARTVMSRDPGASIEVLVREAIKEAR